jgi:class 3 adenylate cyclase
MQEAIIRHIFLDVVGFTHRTVEAQTEIIASMNAAVRRALRRNEAKRGDTILLPTGDGVCICVRSAELPFDVDLRIALDIISNIAQLNTQTADVRRQFGVRIGMNENRDVIVKDINGRNNIAGIGINTAARLMDLADANQIALSESVYQRLAFRDKYTGAFQRHIATMKHGVVCAFHQYIGEGNFVNRDVPYAVRVYQAADGKMPAVVAFYIAYALQLRKELDVHATASADIAVSLLLWYLAVDAAEAASQDPGIMGPQARIPSAKVLGGRSATLQQRLQEYKSIPAAVANDLWNSILDQHLHPFRACFFGAGLEGKILVFGATRITTEGEIRLRREWPDIADRDLS